MLKKLILFAIISGLLTGWFQITVPEAQAIDPVTIAILAPIALKAAQIAAPYIIRALKRMGVAALKAVPDMIGIFKLPIGLIMTIWGWPWGLTGKGIKWTFQGFMAPFKLCWHIFLIFPAMFGLTAG